MSETKPFKPAPRYSNLGVRLTSATKSAFRKKSVNFGGTSTVLRELIEGFVEGRVTIKAPKSKKESLYHE